MAKLTENVQKILQLREFRKHIRYIAEDNCISASWVVQFFKKDPFDKVNDRAAQEQYRLLDVLTDEEFEQLYHELYRQDNNLVERNPENDD